MLSDLGGDHSALRRTIVNAQHFFLGQALIGEANSLSDAKLLEAYATKSKNLRELYPVKGALEPDELARREQIKSLTNMIVQITYDHRNMLYDQLERDPMEVDDEDGHRDRRRRTGLVTLIGEAAYARLDLDKHVYCVDVEV